MGQVYEARHLFLDRAVAVKVLSVNVGRTPAAAERFLREARTLSKIQHPNVVRIFDSGRTREGLFYTVMELLEGADLKQHCASFDGPLPWAHACDILAQLLEGIAAVHAKGVLHRDLKPANTFLAHEPGGVVVKLIDFGVAKPLTLEDQASLTRDGSLIGTPDYLAPELLRGSAVATVQSDLYALGIIAYQMLTGRVPFQGDSMLDRMNAAVSQAPAPLERVVPDLPAEVDDLVMQLLSKRPEDRPANAAQAARRLREVVASDDSLTPTATVLDDDPTGAAPTLDLRERPVLPAADDSHPSIELIDDADVEFVPSHRPWLVALLSVAAVVGFVLLIDALTSTDSVSTPPAVSPTVTAAAAPLPATSQSVPARTPSAAAESPSTPDAPRQAAFVSAPAQTAPVVEPTPDTPRPSVAPKPPEPPRKKAGARKASAKPATKPPAKPTAKPSAPPKGPATDAVLLRRLAKKIRKQCKPAAAQSVSFIVANTGKPLGVTVRPKDASAGCAKRIAAGTTFRTRTSTTPIRLEVPGS